MGFSSKGMLIPCQALALAIGSLAYVNNLRQRRGFWKVVKDIGPNVKGYRPLEYGYGPTQTHDEI